MSGPRTIRDLLEAWLPGLSLDEARALDDLHFGISCALEAARGLPATLDSHSRTLIVTRLEEAEHWCNACTLQAINRQERTP